MNYKYLITFLATLLCSGCVSMDGKMLNAQGKLYNCSTSGGGLGLGAVIGATAALINNELCEAKAEKNGYLLLEDIGSSGIEINSESSDKVTVKAASEPAAPCVNEGNIIKNINDKKTHTAMDSTTALFGKHGKIIDLLLESNSTSKNCTIQLAKK